MLRVLTQTLSRTPVKMSSGRETLQQLRALSAMVERMRQETRSFLETKDRELGEVQSRIQGICTGLVAQSASPVGSGTKRPSKDKLETGSSKKAKEEKFKTGGDIDEWEEWPEDDFKLEDQAGSNSGGGFSVSDIIRKIQ